MALLRASYERQNRLSSQSNVLCVPSQNGMLDDSRQPQTQSVLSLSYFTTLGRISEPLWEPSHIGGTEVFPHTQKAAVWPAGRST